MANFRGESAFGPDHDLIGIERINDQARMALAHFEGQAGPLEPAEFLDLLAGLHFPDGVLHANVNTRSSLLRT